MTFFQPCRRSTHRHILILSLMGLTIACIENAEDPASPAPTPDASLADASVEVDARMVLDGSSESDRVCHLVQDEDLISHIHSKELLPDEYYEQFGGGSG